MVGHKWRNRRWVVLILVNLLFVVSFWLDIQILEGSLTASRLIGFHFIDLNSALQVMLAHKHIIVNLVIGTVTIFVFWMLLGGRSFCSWLCPYHLLAEWAETLHLYLVGRKIVTDHTFHRGTRSAVLGAVRRDDLGDGLYRVRNHIAHRYPVPRPDLRSGPGAGLGCPAAAVRDLLLAPRLVPLRLSHRAHLWRGGRAVAAAHLLPPRQVLPRGRLPQGLSGAACAGHRHQGSRRRRRSAHRTGLHALRPVRGQLPERSP